MNSINNNSIRGVVTTENSQISLHDNSIKSNGTGVAAFDSSSPTINYNNIYGNSSYNVANYKDNPDSNKIDAKNNWWNTTVLEEIEAGLYTPETVYKLTAKY